VHLLVNELCDNAVDLVYIKLASKASIKYIRRLNIFKGDIHGLI